MSFLVISETLGLFFNTLTADDKYSLRKKWDLPQLIQMQLSKKQKRLSVFSAQNLISASIFEHFGIKDYPQSLCISEIVDCK